MSGYCSLHATSMPSGSWARCTWPRLAAAAASWPNLENRPSQSGPSSLAIRRRTKFQPIGGALACNCASSAAYSAGSASGTVDLSTVPDALPAEYAAELAELQANAPAMGWNFVRRRMANELGPDWEGRFSKFGHEAAAAASLGQVHRAQLPDGIEVACKLQYPDMASTVDADLRQLKLALALYHRMDGAIQHDNIFTELQERL